MHFYATYTPVHRHVHTHPLLVLKVSPLLDLASATSQQLSGINISGWKGDLCRGRKERTEPQTPGCEWLLWGRSQVFHACCPYHSSSSHPSLNTGIDFKEDFKLFISFFSPDFPQVAGNALEA